MALLCVAIAFASTARAQTDDDVRVMDELEADHLKPPTACGDGLVSSEATQGHCCWPGQTWSEERQRCAGSPKCPTGWEARGSLCVRGEFVKELGAAPPATKAPAVESAPPRPIARPAPVEAAPKTDEAAPVEAPAAKPIDLGTRPRPYAPDETRSRDRERYEVPYKGGQIPPGWRLETKIRKGLVIPGSIILGVSYTISALTALTQMAGSEGSCVGSTAPIGLVPIVGPLAQGLAYSASSCDRFGSHTSELMFYGVLLSGHQVLGLVMVIVGVKNGDQVLVQDASAMNKPSWDILVGTQGTNQGITLAGRF